MTGVAWVFMGTAFTIIVGAAGLSLRVILKNNRQTQYLKINFHRVYDWNCMGVYHIITKIAIYK